MVFLLLSVTGPTMGPYGTQKEAATDGSKAAVKLKIGVRPLGGTDFLLYRPVGCFTSAGNKALCGLGLKGEKSQSDGVHNLR